MGIGTQFDCKVWSPNHSAIPSPVLLEIGVKQVERMAMPGRWNSMCGAQRWKRREVVWLGVQAGESARRGWEVSRDRLRPRGGVSGSGPARQEATGASRQGLDVIRLAFWKSHPRCTIEVRWGQRRIWGDTLKPFSGGEGFESNRGAEISSKFPTLAIQWAKIPCVEKGKVMRLGGKTVHLTPAS